MWSMIWQKLKEILQIMLGGNTIEQKLHVKPVISTRMENAIQEWTDMYEGHPGWMHEPTWDNPTTVVSLGLPAMIASEKARTALLEMKSDITAPTEEVEIENPDYKDPEEDVFGNMIPSAEPKIIKVEKPIGSIDRAEYLNNQYHKLLKKLRTNLEYGIAKGGLVIKPYVVKTETLDGTVRMEMEFDFVQADAFYPLAFTAGGKIVEAAFIQTRADKDSVYRRLEYHKWENNQVTVVNRAFRTSNTDTRLTNVDLGQEVSLKEVPEWQDLEPEVVIKNVTNPLFAYFKMPEANTIDSTSPLGVSGFARAPKFI